METSKDISIFLYTYKSASFPHKGSALLCTAFAIDTSRDNASRISCTFSTREKSFHTDMLKRLIIPKNPHGAACPGFCCYQHRLIGKKSMSLTSENLKAFLQAFPNHSR